MRIIALTNQKGGVAKTTSTINIGAALAQLHKKVLLVDLDPQHNLTVSLGIPAHELDKTIYDLLKKNAQPEEVIVHRNALDVLPASLRLSAADIELSNIPGREFLLKEALAPVKGYDFILLDSPPSLGLLTLNALTAAQEIFIPLQTQFLALQGISMLMETVQVVQTRLNPTLEVSGIIATLFDGRKKLDREVIDYIQELFGDKLFRTFIRENVALAEAPSFGQTIFEYRINSHGAEDYLALANEIIKMGGR